MKRVSSYNKGQLWNKKGAFLAIMTGGPFSINTRHSQSTSAVPDYGGPRWITSGRFPRRKGHSRIGRRVLG